MRQTTTQKARKGFTLVELLVVISIIAMLLALLVPTVRSAISSAKRARIKTEVDLMHSSLMMYKNEYGSFPPCFGATASGTDRPVKHLRRLFPRCTNPSPQFNGITVSPGNSLLFWLSGYTGDPESPLLPPVNRRTAFDFDQVRSNATTGAYVDTSGLMMPYLYFDSASYVSIDNNRQGTINDTGIGPPRFYIPREMVNGQPGDFLEKDRFIIYSAGLDGEYYTRDDVANVPKEYLKLWLEHMVQFLRQ